MNIILRFACHNSSEWGRTFRVIPAYLFSVLLLNVKERLALINDIENNDMQQPARKQEGGRGFIVFGSICALLSIVLFVLAPFVVSSTIDANKGEIGGGLGGVVVRGIGITMARGIAQGMTMAGIVFGIIGLIMIATGVVREYRRRKTYR